MEKGDRLVFFNQAWFDCGAGVFNAEASWASIPLAPTVLQNRTSSLISWTLMGALYLLPLDQAMASRQDIVYIRFMDDWMLIAPTRWKLRQAVRVVNQTLERLKLEKHPDKTFIGRSSRGLDFLGYSLLPHVIVGPSLSALKRCAARIFQLYEQGADLTRIGRYVRHWCRWYMSGCGLGCRVAVSALRGGQDETQTPRKAETARPRWFSVGPGCLPLFLCVPLLPFLVSLDVALDFTFIIISIVNTALQPYAECAVAVFALAVID